MASSGKRKTTMAKINRERKLQERRLDKAARKDARRNAPQEAPVDEILEDSDAEGDHDLETSGPEAPRPPAAASPAQESTG